jgi:hypothetical protein
MHGIMSIKGENYLQILKKNLYSLGMGGDKRRK